MVPTWQFFLTLRELSLMRGLMYSLEMFEVSSNCDVDSIHLTPTGGATVNVLDAGNDWIDF